MKTKRRSRFLHGLLALALAIAIPATAVATFALQTISPPDAISWHIDFDNMSSPSDSHIDGVTLQASGFTLMETDSHTCLGRVNGSGFFYVRDDNCAFANFETVSVEASIRFDAFPSGSSGGNTPATYPMSLITWMTNTASGSTSYRSIRIDDNGRLYTGTSASTATEVVLTPNEWNKVKLVFEPSSGAYSVYVDGIYGFSGNFGAPATLTSSVIRFFDSRYSYTVSLDDIHIRANKALYWDFGFDTGAALTSTDLEDVSLASTSFVKTTYDNRSCIHVNGRGNFIITDEALALANYETVVVEADLNFAALPTGTYGGKTSYEYPMSLFTWITGESGSTTKQYRSFRIDGDGQIYKGTKVTTDATGTYIPQGEWVNVKLVFSPQNGGEYDLYLNGAYQYTASLGSPSNIGYSAIRLGDTTFHCDLYFDNIRVYSLEDYRIGVSRELSADFLKYQTSSVSEGSFDMRLISTIHTTDYSSAGYRITQISGEQASAYDVSAENIVISESLSAGNFTAVEASEVNGLPILSCVLTGLDASSETEYLIQPYVMKNGYRIYGASAVVQYNGVAADGTLSISQYTQATKYSITVSEDTYVRGGQYADINYGSDKILVAKTDGASYTRYTYLKFDLSGTADRPPVKAYLSLPVNSFDSTNGTVAASIYGVDPNAWEENTLTYNTRPADGELIATFAYGKPAATVDVSDYVKAAVAAGATEVSFRIQNNVTTVAETKFASLESGNGATLSLSCSAFEYETFLERFANRGYEPWGYAEKLVNQWFTVDKAKLYAQTYGSLGIGTVNNNSANGDYSVYNPLINATDHNYVRLLSTLSGFSATTTTLYDNFGGILNSGISGQATGFFHTEKINGRTYIIDPIGNPFYAMGVNTVNTGSTNQQKAAALEKYGTEANFFTSMASEFRNNFGLNSVFGSSEAGYTALMNEGIACVSGFSGINGYMATMGLSVSTGGSSEFLYNDTMNVFDPDFITYADKSAKETAAKYVTKQNFLGYTSDNEIPGGNDMLKRYLTIDSSEPVNAFSYATAWTWFCRATGKVNPSLDDITPELSQEFLAFVYNNYFKIVSSAIRKYDPNHMYIGTRSHTPTKDKEGYLRALGQYADLMTVNMYGRQNYTEINRVIEAMYKYTGLPFIVTEFGVRAKESVDMNGHTLGNYTDTACWLVQTQQQRANSYESYVLNLLESNNCVGWVLYRFRDNDQSVYADGEGNQYLLSSSPKATELMYTNIQTGEVVSGSQVAMTKIYFGETDSSNLSHNKGIYDNHMEPYTEMMTSMKRISDNLLDLIRFFGE